jgi:hypothetical protein
MQKERAKQPAEARDAMPDTVFLHYTQPELDYNYDQRAWARNADEVVARYVSRSAEARGVLRGELDIAYGDGPDDRLD